MSTDAPPRRRSPRAELLAGPRRARSRTGAQARTGGTVRRFFSQLVRELRDDRIADVGAMMAYYAILALFPMLVFVLTLAMLVVDAETIRQGVEMATRTLPPATAELIAGRVQVLVDTAAPGFAVGSAAIALWGASRGAAALSSALNAMFDREETRPWWRRQATAIAVTLGVALVTVLALALLVAGPIAGHWIADRFGLGDAFDAAWALGRWIGAGLLVMVIWAVLYKFLPDTNAPLRIFTPGAIAGVLLWLGVSFAFAVYLDHFDRYEATYGALGGAIVFLTWLWLSNVALLFGAQVNDVLAEVRSDRSAAARRLAGAVEPSRSGDAASGGPREVTSDPSRSPVEPPPRPTS